MDAVSLREEKMVTFSDIQDAFLFVNGAPYGMHTAILEPATGRILYRSEDGGLDEIGDADEIEDGINIPHKNDLGLGKSLALDFVASRIPDQIDRVEQMFRRRGAYARFKDFLDSKGLLQEWYDYENKEEEWALRRWCKKTGIELSD